MTPEQRKAALKAKGITQKDIAEDLRVSEMSVSRMVNHLPGQPVSDYIMTGIGKRIGRPKHRVFPEYYIGPKKRSTSKAFGKSNRYNGASQCLSAGAK